MGERGDKEERGGRETVSESERRRTDRDGEVEEDRRRSRRK